ncbi:RluA family pseudouridine synthase [bacterium]|nr:RluA family pseudouridine synthase [bacterium]
MRIDELYEESKEYQIYKIVAPAQFETVRIDKYVSNSIADIARNRVCKLIESKYIQSNNTLVERPSLKVKAGDVLTVKIPLLRRLRAEAEAIPLDIVYEDEYMLIINKEPGMVVHPAVGNRSGTLVNALANHCTSLSSINGEYRPGIVHRLDKYTSGIIMAAKTDKIHNILARKFEYRKLSKTYLAIVWGQLKEKKGEITTSIGRHKGDRKKFSVQKDGKSAETHYEVLEEFEYISFVKIKLITGRTHQIRVHFSDIGHPVLGDTEYGGRTKKLKSLSPYWKNQAIEILDIMHRQALHSFQIELAHPHSEEKMEIQAPLPKDMQQTLEILRQRREV